MGKKGSWFSAIKRVFIPSSKEKLIDGTEKKSTKEKKKKGLGRRKHGDGHSFIPLFREPSSIEKILGEAEREHNLINFRSATPIHDELPPKTPPDVPPPSDFSSTPLPPPRAAASPRGAAASPRATAASPQPPTPQRAASPPWNPTPPRITSPPRQLTPLQVVPPPQLLAVAPPSAPTPNFAPRQRPEPTLRYQHICATRIQTAYRGYTARRNYRSVKGLVRLEAVMKGQSVKRQTVNAMKCMQLLVRVQTQIQTRRIQMLENQALQRQSLYKDNKWGGQGDEWDDSILPKEEIDARTQRKAEAVMKRERAMSYAYSHQSWRSNKRWDQAGLMDFRSGGFPWWWNWLERQVPQSSSLPKPSENQSLKNLLLTPPRSAFDSNTPSPLPQSSNFISRNQNRGGFDSFDTPTPRSTRSAAPISFSSRATKTPPGRLPQKYNMRSRGHSPFNGSFRDDDSLTSCPPFSAPRYMEPTVSAKAKVRAGSNSNPKERSSGATTPTSEVSKRRVSFPLSQDMGSFKWNKRSPLFTGKDSSSQGVGKDQSSVNSIGNRSVDSTLSMPATVGRKPFNRFV